MNGALIEVMVLGDTYEVRLCVGNPEGAKFTVDMSADEADVIIGMLGRASDKARHMEDR